MSKDKDTFGKAKNGFGLFFMTVLAVFVIDVIVGIWYPPAVTWISAIF